MAFGWGTCVQCIGTGRGGRVDLNSKFQMDLALATGTYWQDLPAKALDAKIASLKQYLTVAKKILESRPEIEHKNQKWIQAQITLHSELWNLRSCFHKFSCLGVDLPVCLQADTGKISFDLVGKAIIATNSALTATEAATLDAPTVQLGSEHSADEVVQSDVTPVAQKFLKGQPFTQMFAVEAQNVQGKVSAALEKTGATALNHAQDGAACWWGQIEEEKKEDFDHIMEVAGSTLGQIDGGLLKTQVDECFKAILDWHCP